MQLQVNTTNKNYPIYIENNFKNLKHAFEKAGLLNKKILIVSDKNVEELYLKTILNEMENITKDVHTHIFNPGEENKNMDTLKSMYQSAMEHKLDRKSVMVALGGGVTGDMAGFCAATYLRGIKYVQIPTTLLSQVDSSVGGKTAIDFMGGKNIIGAFYQPEFVYTNINTLKTLPECEFISGMGEVIKHGLIKDNDFFQYIMRNKENIKNMEESSLSYVVEKCCMIKSNVVEKDEKEQGIREILNLGHTFGHSFESLSDFKLSHGKSISLGMICAIHLSNKFYNISESDIENVKDVFTYFNLPIESNEFKKEDVYAQMFYDKKIKEGKITLVLLDTIGEAVVTDKISKEDMMWAIETVCGK